MLSFGGEELNPIVRYFFEKLGIIPGLLILKTVAILSAVVFYVVLTGNKVSSRRKKIYSIVFFILIFMYIAVNVHNWYLVLQI